MPERGTVDSLDGLEGLEGKEEDGSADTESGQGRVLISLGLA